MHFSFSSSVFLVVAVLEWQERKTNESKRIAITSEPPLLGLMLRSFVTGLVSATVTGGTTKLIWLQLIDKVGAAVLYINEVRIFATISGFRLSKADVLFDTTLSYCRVITIQPGRETSTAFVNRWTSGYHFSPCISMETIPALERVVTFGTTCCIGPIFSVCVCQIYVLGTINYRKRNIRKKSMTIVCITFVQYCLY